MATTNARDMAKNTEVDTTMTALADNQPFVAWFPSDGLWVAWGYGFIGTGDDKEEAVEMWSIIYELEEKCHHK